MCIMHPLMQRINITVPDELFARMKEARARGSRIGPNWSEIACRAFEAVVQELQNVRPTMSAAVRLPYPTTGDYTLFEVRRGRGQLKVKVSGTVCAPRYVHRTKLPRIVAVFAADFIANNPDVVLKDGGVLPVMLGSADADEIAARL
jgi:hypothetical protein